MCAACQDIKPGNIFLDGTGTFQIGDFGLAVLRQQWVRPSRCSGALSPSLLRECAPCEAANSVCGSEKKGSHSQYSSL